MISQAMIRDLVGAAAYLRGRRYADSGAVVSYEAKPSAGALHLTGLVQGGDRRPYEVFVDVESAHDRVGLSDGDCSCPVGWNCKHVAALLIVVAAEAEPAPASAEGPAPWAAALQPFLEPEGAADPVVGLQFELVDAGGRGAAVTLRPVVPGAKGRWVRTGISWGNLAHHQARRADPAAFRLLEEIAALSGATQRAYYYPAQHTVDLSAFPSARIWPVLASAAGAGLPLVRSGSGGHVVLATDPADLTLDVTDDGGGGAWQVRPLVAAGGGVLPPGCFLLLGVPAHGVAWWDPHDIHGELRVAGLARPLADDVHSLVAHRGGIEVPADETDNFLRVYYPSLRRRVLLTSSDGTVDLPEPEPPRLGVRVTYRGGHRVEVGWVWRYPIGDAVREVPLAVPAETDPDRDAEAEAKLLVGALSCAQSMPALLTGLASAHPRIAHRVELAGAEALIDLAGVLEGLAELPGVEVLAAGEAPRLRKASAPPVIGLGGQAVDGDWFDLDISVSVDGENVPFVWLFLALAKNERYLLLPGGTYVDLAEPEMRQLHDVIAEARAMVEPGQATARVSRYQLGVWAELRRLADTSRQAEEWAASVCGSRGLAATDEVEVPASLRATLRPYQRAGFAWLAFLYSHRLGGVLADDMGLGKTVQAIALFCHAREAEPAGPPFLVVAPTSVVGNWVAELRRFAPHLRVAAINATHARRRASLAEAVAGVDVVVTSYALLRLEHAAYEAQPWAALVLDEAQAVKNHAARGYQCARAIPAPAKFAITGTPMENNLMELWAAFSIVAPGLLGDARRFGDHYRQPIERGADAERLAQLRRRIGPLMLRRRKEEVAAELPAKIESIVEVELAPKHRRVYDTLLARERQKVLGLLGDLDRHRIEILRSLTMLRQAALDPSLVDPDLAGPGRGGVPATKLDVLMVCLNEVVAEGHRVLVFSQFTRFLGRVRERLDGAGIAYCYLDGRTRDRAAVIESFASGAADVFLLSLKAGGVGLNLTQADYCILLDPWWNPAAEAQAVDRAHRIGQTRPVVVYRLVAKDTIEEKVMALKEAKAKLVSSVLDGGDAGSASLSADDIRALLD